MQAEEGSTARIRSVRRVCAEGLCSQQQRARRAGPRRAASMVCGSPGAARPAAAAAKQGVLGKPALARTVGAEQHHVLKALLGKVLAGDVLVAGDHPAGRAAPAVGVSRQAGRTGQSMQHLAARSTRARAAACPAQPCPAQPRPAPERRLLAPGHGAQLLQRVDGGKAAAGGHAQRQVALPKVESIVQHHDVYGRRRRVRSRRVGRGVGSPLPARAQALPCGVHTPSKSPLHALNSCASPMQAGRWAATHPGRRCQSRPACRAPQCPGPHLP